MYLHLLLLLLLVLLYVAGMLASPESPVYLLGKGQTEEAKKVATNLWGADGPAQLGSPKSKYLST